MDASPMAGEADPVIALLGITVRVRDRWLLDGTTWRIQPGEQWAVVGPNGAGKSTLVRALAGEFPIVRGKVVRSDLSRIPRVGVVSFELHRELIAREEGRDDARHFSGDWASQTTVRELLDDPAATAGMPETAARSLEIVSLLDRTIRALSTGEMRKALIARALARSPGLLILDEPFDGLDESSRSRFTALIGRLMAGGTQIVLVTHRPSEVPPEVTHLLEVRDGKVVRQGPREVFFAGEKGRGKPHGGQTAILPIPFPGAGGGLAPFEVPPVLVEMRKVRVRCGDAVILADLDWTVRRGENWTLLGENGAGKTTLLRLISGDHPQAYGNEITLFGRRRGSGESLREVRAPIGMVSSEFQIGYRKGITALEVVLSGFHDSVGLFRRCTPLQAEAARDWLRCLGIADLAHRPFPNLSQGEQRMVLLARALVKSPALLILDEPCQGLDPENRSRLLSLIEAVGRHTPAHLLYVTHHPEEIPDCTTHILRLVRGPGGASAMTEPVPTFMGGAVPFRYPAP